MLPESQGCAPAGSVASALLAALAGSSVTVCLVALVVRHVTVAPLTTVSGAGSNLSASDIVTVAAVVAAGVLAELAPVPAVAAGAARGVAVFDGAQAVTNVMIASNIPTCSRTSERCNAFTRRTS